MIQHEWTPAVGTWRSVAGLATLILALFGVPMVANAGEHAVYTTTNAGAGNQVLVFRDGPGVPLQLEDTVSTHGLGTDAGLGSQGAVVLSGNGRWLFVVNAGSNDITTFRVGHEGDLTFASRSPSGGTQPISLTQHEDLVYVLNAGGAGNITGFRARGDGSLEPIPGSTRGLGGSAVGPAQVGFNTNGDILVVTEKAANRIALYQVDAEGAASDPQILVSAGKTPFGFAIDRHDHLLVSEAFGGTVGASAVSSYELEDDSIEVETASSPTHQTAACWVVVTRRGRYAYTTNTGSGTVTGYRVLRDGDLQPLTTDGATGVTGPGSAPTDAALSAGDHVLYVLTANVGGVARFTVHLDGSLTSIGAATGVPVSSVGLAVRSID
jgi:6-phosphogluconolactonase